jgi:hypothetical protein
MTIFAALGIFSAMLFLIGDFPYLTDTLKGKTKPQRVTWGVAFLLNSIGLANQYASGADNSLWLFGAAVIATGAIFIASIFKGVGGYSKLDIFAVVTTILGVFLWIIFDSPLMSIISILFIVEISLVPTIVKAKKHPESETKIAWLLGSISSFIAAVSVGKLDWSLLVLPINAALVQAYIVYILYFRVKRHPEEAVAPVHSPAETTEL